MKLKKLNNFILWLGFVFLLIIVVTPLTVFASEQWAVQIVTVTSSNIEPYSCSLALDSIGYPHIAFRGGYYTKLTTSSWILTKVPNIGEPRDISLELDTNKYPHIVCSGIMYARWTGTDWSTYTVNTTLSGRYDLELGPNDSPCVVYQACSYQPGNDKIEYSTSTNYTDWSTQQLTEKGSEIGAPSLALDPSGTPHIVFKDNTRIKYAKWTGTGWNIEDMDIPSASLAEQTGIATDGNGYPHIAACKCYKKWTGSNWETHYPFGTSGAGTASALDLDSLNYAHVFAYIGYADSPSTLQYARWTGSVWDVQIIRDDYPSGGSTALSIAVDGKNKPHIIFVKNNILFYAKLTSYPTIYWTEEPDYISDGLNPEVGNQDTTFYFRIKYTDIDNDLPMFGYPKVHIKRDGIPIPGSPFVMTELDPGDTNYADGKLYSYSTNLTVLSTSYTYFFEAYDIWGATATPTPELNGPMVDNAPTLTWTGEANYVSDGLNPEVGDRATTFTYRVKYTDVDNHAPKFGYPKVHIKKGGVEISGSPFTMSYVSGFYTTGAIFTFSTSTLAIGQDYSYFFEAYDILGATATPTPELNGPDVLNNDPTLTWTGEVNYVSDGVDPETGTSTTTFIFRIKYTDSDNDAPKLGYPRVRIKRDNVEISGSPFTMSYVSGYYNTGAIYSYSTTLWPSSTFYTYYFEAKDIYDGTAAPTTEIDGPDVTNTMPTLSWTDEVNYVSDGIHPEIGTSTFTYTYRVKYTDLDNDPPLSGYPKVHVLKGGVEISGSPFSMDYISGNFNTGAIYSYSIILSSGMDYTYFFEAYDKFSWQAIGIATGTVDAPDVSGWHPTLNWTDEEGYTSDGVEQDLAPPGSAYTWRVKYTDYDNDPPSSGYPKVYLKKGDLDLTGSPFTMAEVDPGDTVYSDGKLYTYTKILTDYGSDYTYYFESKDKWGWSAIGVAASTKSGPIVSSAPVLSWTGEEGYTSDGLEPEVGTTTMTYTYRVKYTDLDNDPPLSGYPKLWILKDGTTVYSMTMSYVSGIYNTGAIYSTSVVLSEATTTYRYYFEAYDTFGATVPPTSIKHGPALSIRINGYVRNPNNTPMSSVKISLTGTVSSVTYTDSSGYYEFRELPGGNYTVTPSSHSYYSFSPSSRDYTNIHTYQQNQDFKRTNAAPVLSWTGESGYVSDGLEPDISTETVVFTYRIKYADADNDAPLSGYPKVNVLQGATTIQTLIMNYVSGDYLNGAIYSTSTLLPPCSYYSYTFEACDVWNTTATQISGIGPDTKLYIKGYVKDPQGKGLGSVTLALSGDGSETCITNSQGYYEFIGLTAGGNYTVTPSSHSYYSFNPSSRTYSNLMSLKTEQNFTRINTSPALSWTQENDNYTDTGVYPSTGMPNKDTFVFRIKYTDSENDPTFSGYPKLYIKKGGTNISGSPFTMSYVSGEPLTGVVYSYSKVFESVGNDYTYYFEVKDKYQSSATTQEKQFTVSSPPTEVENKSGITDGQTVTTGKIVLSWESSDPDGDSLTYYLYLSKGQVEQQMQLIYTGKDTSYILYDLEPGTIFYWRVDVEDQNGILVKGQVLSFKTLSINEDKVLNYPNPFNPQREKTNIVFYAKDTGSAEIKIYTEFGEKIFEDTFSVMKGTNEYPYDGKDSNGNILMNGTYVVTVKVDNKLKKTAILVLKK
ncbi:MAG: carboxypeptidase regulatory-like domain-containing protein [Elusimicrobiota bacterium]|nr:carboxypeptidase regulatory-like domain-containing protein [Elusimicrobiota bacterium]